MDNNKINTEFAKKRTLLANQRTYLSYIRTGFTIAAIAGQFNYIWIVMFGVIMIITSSYQYYKLTTDIINNDIIINNEYMPLIYLPLSLIVLYLQYNKKKE